MLVPRTLLLVAGASTGQDAGEVFLRDLCQFYPNGRLCRFSLVEKVSKDLPQSWLGFPVEYAETGRNYGLRRFGESFGRLTGFPIQRFIREFRIPGIAKQAADYGRRCGVQQIWAVLNSPALIYLVQHVAAALNVPYVVTVWDPPERFAVDHVLDPLSRRILMKDFDATLVGAARCGVASEAMKIAYATRYGKESVVQIHGIHPDLRLSEMPKVHSTERFVIGIAGNLYARHEWEALLSALSVANWRIENREIVLRVMGASINLRPGKNMRVEYFGWRSLPDVIHLLSTVDVTYLPYWFDVRYQSAVRLCFPNKLSAYLAAAKPVLFHGPQDSSVGHFFKRYPVGIVCSSLKEEQILASLERFISDSAFLETAKCATQSALDEELDLRIFRRRFAGLIGIDETDLLPLSKYTS